MSEFEHLFSSQGSRFDQEQILPDNVASSPPPFDIPAPRKERKPPTITPKRFTRFFTPRHTLREGTQSRASGRSGRQLKDITRNAINRKSQLSEAKPVKPLDFEGVDLHATPQSNKRRKLLPSPESSPIQSSPLRRLNTDRSPIHVFEDAEGRAELSEDDDIASLCDNLQSFAKPIRRRNERGTATRLLQRSFGGTRAVGRGRLLDSCSNWQDATANFYSQPGDVHSFRGSALPFCSTACNSNSLVAIGDEEGGIRLVDSSVAEGIEFANAYVSFRPHRNAVMDIAFSSDDYLFATASGDQTARVIDMRTQQTRYIMAGHTSSVKQVRFQPGNDSIVATSSRDGSVQIWDLRCRGSDAPAKDFRVSLDTEERNLGAASRQVIYSSTNISIRDAHAQYGSSTLSATCGNLFSSKPEPAARRNDISITALSFLPSGREHLLLTASESNASVKLWDIRAKFSSRRGPALPVSATREPDSHNRHRHFGISSLALSGDGARLYALCKDSTVYTYSTNHVVLGHAPELSNPPPKWRRPQKEGQLGAGPLYGFRHPQLHATSFYVKASIRPAQRDQCEMLAVGSRDACAVLFPTDESNLQQTKALVEEESEDEDELPTSALPRRAGLPTRATSDTIPIYERGTALVRGHQSEVTSLTWTADGELVTIGDDFVARCWREGTKARDLRTGGEAEGRRWGCGWASVREGYDDEE